MPHIFSAGEGKMAVEDDESRMALLKREFEASLARINMLERENQDLRQEIARLKAHEMDRKSMLWKKIQTSPMSEAQEQSPAMQKQKPVERPAGTGPKPLPRLTLFSPKQENEVKVAAAPPAPPPPPSKSSPGSKTVRRVPQVMEFYRLLMKRDAAQRENRDSGSTRMVPIPNPKNMIGEIENRSTYLSAIKADVEGHGEFISYLSKEVETAAFSEISDVESFVKWLDGELSCLVDERAVLKHFPKWPEKKADAMREAACSYIELKNLQSQVSSYKDDPKQQLTQSLRKMQALQDRLERSVSNIEKVREATSKKYGEFHIPWQWMLDTGLIGQMKLSSLTLAKTYMKRIAKELHCNASSRDELLLQSVRFALRIHQFAGGFDTETVCSFEELRKIGSSNQ